MTHTKATIGQSEATADNVVEMYALSRGNSLVVMERYVRDVEMRKLLVFRTEWSYIYPHKRGTGHGLEEVEGGFEKTRSQDSAFDLVGTDTTIVEHDGRDWKVYARERFRTLMGKRLPDYP